MPTIVELLRRPQKWSILIVLAVILIALPFLIPWVYDSYTALPKRITIATGKEGGLYVPLSQSLASRIRAQLGVEVREISSNGSLHNLLLLHKGEADLALYQPGVREVMNEHDPSDLAEAMTKLLAHHSVHTYTLSVPWTRVVVL